MTTLQTLFTLFPVALASGINLYATVLVVGLSARFGWVASLPGGLDILGSGPVLIAAGILFLLEFVADKIPALDNLWDLIHTPIRPLGAALVALLALTGSDSPLAVAAALAAGGVALVSHGGKAGTRIANNVSNPASTVTNPIASVVEDLSAAGLALLALKYPVPAAIVAGVAFLLILVFVPLFIRWTFFALRAFGIMLVGIVRKVERSDRLPADHRMLIGGPEPELVARCRAQGIRGANGRGGFLSLQQGRVLFTFHRRSQSRIWGIEADRGRGAGLRRRFLVDILEVAFRDEKDRARVVRFVFTKERSRLAERFAAILAGG